MVVVVLLVLNPWNKIVDAMITLVEKVTKYVGLTLRNGLFLAATHRYTN
jgi:hypothetical protein